MDPANIEPVPEEGHRNEPDPNEEHQAVAARGEDQDNEPTIEEENELFRDEERGAEPAEEHADVPVEDGQQGDQRRGTTIMINLRTNGDGPADDANHAENNERERQPHENRNVRGDLPLPPIIGVLRNHDPRLAQDFMRRAARRHEENDVREAVTIPRDVANDAYLVIDPFKSLRSQLGEAPNSELYKAARRSLTRALVEQQKSWPDCIQQYYLMWPLRPGRLDQMETLKPWGTGFPEYRTDDERQRLRAIIRRIKPGDRLSRVCASLNFLHALQDKDFKNLKKVHDARAEMKTWIVSAADSVGDLESIRVWYDLCASLFRDYKDRIVETLLYSNGWSRIMEEYGCMVEEDTKWLDDYPKGVSVPRATRPDHDVNSTKAILRRRANRTTGLQRQVDSLSVSMMAPIELEGDETFDDTLHNPD